VLFKDVLYIVSDLKGEKMKFLFKRIPAATMIIPMFITAIINSLFPQLLEMGGVTTALFSKAGVAPLVGAILFLCGTQLKIKEAPEAIKRGGVLLVAKFIAGYVTGTLVNKLFGPAGFLGISTLAIFTTILSSNGAIYLALTGEYGDQTDLGAYGVLSIKDGPFLTLLALGASGAASIPVQSLLSSVFPMILGVILGNLYKGIQQYFKAGTHILIPLAAISVGASLDIRQLVEAGFSGLILGILVLVVSAIVLIAADKFILRRPGYAGAALATVAGSAIGTPIIVAGIVPGLQKTAEIASVQAAAAVIVTAVLCPLLTSWSVKKWGSPKLYNEAGRRESFF
jgi:2-keto-3-deoxygluconate permease